jgi:alkylation response protein AidB-like acyl-CoA dehydrogenase
LTLEYAKDRFAFGRPIGSFQALKHMCADMYGWLESGKAIACAATDAVHEGAGDRAQTVSAAKAYIGEYGSRIVQDCMQIHGGIAYTWDHDLHLHLRRIKSNEVLYGDPAWHRERICKQLDL